MFELQELAGTSLSLIGDRIRHELALQLLHVQDDDAVLTVFAFSHLSRRVDVFGLLVPVLEINVLGEH